MGKIIDIAAEIQRDNPHARLIDVHVFADALRIYHEAAANVAANGAICSHPRTGAPIENPYLKIQAQQGIILGRMKTIKSDRVMDLLDKSGGAE